MSVMGMRTGSSPINQKARSGMPARASFDCGFCAPDVRRLADRDTGSASSRFDPWLSVSTSSAGLPRLVPARSDDVRTPDLPACAHTRYVRSPGAETVHPPPSGALSVLLVRFDPFQAFLLE